AKTKTRSKKSSTGVTRCSCSTAVATIAVDPRDSLAPEQPREPIGTPTRREVVDVPASSAGPCSVRALEERQECLAWISSRPNRSVGKHGERPGAELGPVSSIRQQGLGTQTVGLGVRVRVVARLAHVLVTCPEAEGNELVRVRILRYRVGLG